MLSPYTKSVLLKNMREGKVIVFTGPRASGKSVNARMYFENNDIVIQPIVYARQFKNLDNQAVLNAVCENHLYIEEYTDINDSRWNRRLHMLAVVGRITIVVCSQIEPTIKELPFSFEVIECNYNQSHSLHS